jgi:Winged helix DNA-binding domain
VPELVSTRALNRALLARQGLLARLTITVPEALEHLVGLQAQAPNAPYYGLWSRLTGFTTDDLAELLLTRRAVRIVLMRSTVHLVTARDCLELRPLVAPMLERQLMAGSPWGRALAGMDLDALVVAGREILEQQPLANPELARRLEQLWPERDGESMAQGLRNLLPLVQLPPRGIWGAGGVPTLTTAESWIGAPLAADATLDGLVTRYLAAFGPASVRDAQTWCGVTRLGAVFERLRPELLVLVDEQGRELFDLPAAPRPDPETPAPPRFLPAYDNALVSHADRRRIIAAEHRERVFTKGTLLVDGFVCGTWKLTSRRRTGTLAIETFRRLSQRHLASVEREGELLLAFAAADAPGRELVVSVGD